MAHVLVLGGGFAGVAAAESLAKRLGSEHHITLLSRQREFVFYPALVQLAFGQCEVSDITYDLRTALLDRRVRFIQSEIAYPDFENNCVIVPHGEVQGKISYDYLVFALGRRLATENVQGFYDYAHHLLTVNAALCFRTALENFQRGNVVLGYSPDTRLAVPVFEAAFALDRWLQAKGTRAQTNIIIVSPEELGGQLGGAAIVPQLQKSLDEHGIQFVANFPVTRITEKSIYTAAHSTIDYDLLMLLPPFTGPGEALYTGITDPNGYVRVDRHLKITSAERAYAAGDCVNFLGPKMGHMAVLQGMVAAANVAAEINGQTPNARYDHELMLVIDAGGKDSLYLQKSLWEKSDATIKQSRFWSWAKQVQQKYWQHLHA